MIRWLSHDDPRINKGCGVAGRPAPSHNTPVSLRSAWTPDEDKALLQLAAEFGQRDWVKIASRLNVGGAPCRPRGGSPRPPARPDQSHGHAMLHALPAQPQPAAHQIVRASPLARRHGSGSRRPAPPFRPRARRKWTPEEDEKLKEMVHKHGDRNWQTVALAFEGRTDQQCLHRWTKSLNPAIHSGRWDREEDMVLRVRT